MVCICLENNSKLIHFLIFFKWEEKNVKSEGSMINAHDKSRFHTNYWQQKNKLVLGDFYQLKNKYWIKWLLEYK